MDIIGFFGSVWLSIFVGIFALSMIVGCTFDRRQHEGAKWWVFGIGVGIWAIHSWNTGYRPSWEGFLSADLWKFIAIYLAIGLGYSVLEFALDVRRSVRYWKEKWDAFRTIRFGKSEDNASPEDRANTFVSQNTGYSRNRIIGVGINDDKKDTDTLIVPKVNRGELAEHIGCWMVFWPFYAVSLIIGDLMYEVAVFAADVFAKISGRFVRLSFANVFKF